MGWGGDPRFRYLRTAWVRGPLALRGAPASRADYGKVVSVGRQRRLDLSSLRITLEAALVRVESDAALLACGCKALAAPAGPQPLRQPAQKLLQAGARKAEPGRSSRLARANRGR